MELKIISPQESGFVQAIEWNHEELKAEISAKMAEYKTLVFTEATIKDAKSDRASLNKLKSAIEDERKRIKKLCLTPYNAFEAKVKEITALIDEPISIIDKQIKEVEEAKRQEKSRQIEEIFTSVEFPPELTLDQIKDPKWLNASVSLKSIREDMEELAKAINQHLKTLLELPQFGFEAAEYYKRTWDFDRAIAEAKRMTEIQAAKLQAEEEARRREEERALAEAEEEQTQLEIISLEDGDEDLEEANFPGMNPPIRSMRIVFEVVANEKQYDVLNKALSTLKENADMFRIVEKEDL